MILLATSPRRLGRAGHVELLLLLGDVGQARAQPLVRDNRGVVDLRPFVEGAIREIDPIVPDRQSPDFSRRLAHTAFKHVAYAELAPDLLDIDGFALVSKTRIARDHERQLEPRERCDDVVYHSVREIVLP